MDHLDEITVEQLQQALDEVDRKKPTQRLTAAIAYKRGISQTEIASWYDVQRRTVYSWLKRLEDGPLVQVVTDERRSGRPRKLSDDQLARLEGALHESPKEAGFDRAAWTPTLVQQYLDENFDVEYSRPSCRRLMKEAGLTYQKHPQTATREDCDGNNERENSTGCWVPQ